MAVPGTTPILGLVKPVFRGNFWHEDMWANFDKIDAFSGLVPVELVLEGKANLNSPVFTGNPQAPTAPINDNDLSLANTQWVQKELLDGLNSVSQFIPCTDYDMLIGTTSARAVTPWAAYQLWRMNFDPNPVGPSIILKHGAYFQMADGTATITNINFEQNTYGRWATIRWGNGNSVLSNTAGSNLFLPGGNPIITRQGDTCDIVMHGTSCIVKNYTRSQASTNRLGLLGVRQIASSQIYTVPPNAYWLRIRIVGGGGGAGGTVQDSGVGTGGGGGSYAEVFLSTLPNTGYVITIGAGGGGGAASGSAVAGAGGTSSILNQLAPFTSVVNCPGGGGGQAMGDLTTQGSPIVYNGGTTPGPATVTQGLPITVHHGDQGGYGFRTGTGAQMIKVGGRGGSTPFGIGGHYGAMNGHQPAVSGSNGSGFGVGAGGGVSSLGYAPGGLGGVGGVCIIEEYGLVEHP